MDYFISDTHFNHDNIISFERDEFESIKEHNDYIFNLLEEKLTKYDTLYHLGDFGSIDEAVSKRWIDLPCKKILIVGNHDKKLSDLRPLFDEVHKEPIFYKKRILLSHEPLPVTNGTINVHGHLHGAYLDKPNYINISFSVYNNSILKEDDLFKFLHGIEKDNWKFLKEWYANSYVFIKENSSVVTDETGKIILDKSKIKLQEKDDLK